MKIITNHKNGQILNSSNITASEVGMDERGAKMAMMHMRNNIYTQKDKAPVREYTSNCVDEHRKHGITVPVKININHTTSIVSFQDFALGLSDEDIRNIYGFYFRSTKEGNNDGIGGFGVGSKSFFALEEEGLEAFYVESNFEGTMTRYMVSTSIGDDGLPNAVVMNIHSEPTDITGLKVYADLSCCASKGTMLDNMTKFAKTFLYTMEDSLELTVVKHEWNKGDVETVFTTMTPDHIHELDVGTLRVYSMESMNKSTPSYTRELQCQSREIPINISVGGVYYISNIDSSFRSDIDSTNATYVLDIPIGSVSIPISRERIETGTRNDKYVTRCVKSVKEYIDSLTSLKSTDIIEVIYSNDNNTKLICSMIKDNGDRPLVAKEYSTYGIFNRFTYISHNQPFIEIRKAILDKVDWTDTAFDNIDVYGELPTDHDDFSTLIKTVDLLPKKYQTIANIDPIKVYVVPNIKNPKPWVDRLTAYDPKAYLIIREEEMEYFDVDKSSRLKKFMDDVNMKVDFLDMFEFIKVKEMGLPKLPKKVKGSSTKRFVFNRGTYYNQYNGSSRMELSVGELVDHVDNSLGYKEPLDWSDITDPLVSYENLSKKTIVNLQTYGNRSTTHKVFFINAQTVIKDLLDNHGFVVYNSNEYNDRVKALVEKEKIGQDISSRRSKLDALHIKLTRGTIDRASKTEARTKRIMVAHEAMLKKVPLFEKIMLSNNSYYTHKFTRPEQRELYKKLK
jgi:hypothetical protein